MMIHNIKFDDDINLKKAAALYKNGKRHALKGESPDGINCMLQALSILEPMKGEDHRILRGECLYFIGMMEIWRCRYGTAHDMLSEATKLNPKAAVYWVFLAQACMYLGCDVKAKHAAMEAEKYGNDNVVNHMLSTLWEYYGDNEKSLHFSILASQASQDNPDACYLLGNSNYIKGDKKEAQKWYARAIELNPEHADANYGYGLILSEGLKFRESLPYFEKGIKSQISSANSQWGKALAHLSLGELLQGFKDHECRFVFLKQEFGNERLALRMDKPQWNGEVVPSRIHVYSEQGFGDCIQYCRYIHNLIGMGHDVTFEVDNSMVDLMKFNFQKANVVPLSDNYPGTNGIPEVDYRIPLGSLPYAFKTILETIPFSEKYLYAEPHKIKQWSFIRNTKEKKIGLCWAGGKRFQDAKLVAMDEKRSISFNQLISLLSVPNVKFFSLQTGLAAEQDEIFDLMKGIKSWSDTAAIIANLDMVISVDTSVLHMAAAMGKTTYLLNKYWTCWRWMLDRTDSPWYKSLRIFRPEQPEDWSQVIADVRGVLCQS